MISASDFVFVYSGGPNNDNPSQSLGGIPSAVPIPSTIDNLFDDLDPTQAANGFVDYRCIYVFNEDTDDGLFDANVFIGQQEEGGAYVELGFDFRNDRQSLTVLGPAVSGQLLLAYDGYPLTVDFLPDKDQFAHNLQNALNNLPQLSGVVCEGIDDNGAITVFINFEGFDSKRYHPKLILIANNVDGSTGINILKLVDGSPVNAIAPSVSAATQAPGGVIFGSPTDMFNVGIILPGDGIPVWARRTTPQNATGVRYDGFLLQFLGSPNTPVFPEPPPIWATEMTGGIVVGGAADAVAHNAGIYESTMTGGLVLSGEAAYVLTFATGDGIQHFVTSGNGGIKTGGVAITSLAKKFVGKPSGGIVVRGTATTSTTGISNLPSASAYGCPQFPIGWSVGVTGTYGASSSSNCGCNFVFNDSLLDFNPTTGSWIGPLNSGMPDAGPIMEMVLDSSLHGYYYELSYNDSTQKWDLKAHAPVNPSGGNNTDCTLMHTSWAAANWNCCGVNNLSTSESTSFTSSCAIATYNLTLTPYRYCAPTPFQIRCGKCALATKVPNTITLHTQFGAGSTCQATALAGTFTLQRYTSIHPCHWVGDIPALPNVKWVMGYTDHGVFADSMGYIYPTGLANKWYITAFDPMSTYVMWWTISDQDFNCCAETSAWDLNESNLSPCNPGVGSIATTTPVTPTGCH